MKNWKARRCITRRAFRGRVKPDIIRFVLEDYSDADIKYVCLKGYMPGPYLCSRKTFLAWAGDEVKIQ